MHAEGDSKLYGLLCTALLWLAPSLADAQTLTSEIESIMSSRPHAATQVSAHIVHLPSGEVVYEHSANVAVIPASNQKIITAAAALSILGPQHTFDTELRRQDRDLVMVGHGDPAFGDPRLAARAGESADAVLERWADEVSQLGITQVQDIIIDDSAFDRTWLHHSWETEDFGKWYAAPVGALSFFNNCVEFTLIPTAASTAVDYVVFPNSDAIIVDNQCLTGSKQSCWIQRLEDGSQFRLKGHCNKRVTLKPVAVEDPGMLTASAFKQALQQRKIAVRGTIRRDTADPLSTLVARHQTPIIEVLRRAQQDSQNLFAECLIKASGRIQSKRPGTWTNGQEAVLSILKQQGIDTTTLVIADGSGLSRDNRLSAKHVTAVLKAMYFSPTLGEPFIDSLSLNGRNGTLRKRLRDLPGRIWAKSGYMRGIRTLSGYVHAEAGHWYAFSIMFNGIPGGTAPYNNIHDAVCRLLITHE